ncbi:MAG: hypothetical protein ABIL16_05565 [candidate division WOR-3 bacterium]
MLSLAFNINLFATFPGLVNKELPIFFGYPAFGVNAPFGEATFGIFEVGGIRYSIGEENIVLLNSSLGFGGNIGKWELAFGFSGTTAGIPRLNIYDQSYTAIFLRGGYRLKFLKGGINLPIYLLAQEGKFSVLPAPMIYVSLSTQR